MVGFDPATFGACHTNAFLIFLDARQQAYPASCKRFQERITRWGKFGHKILYHV